MMTVSTQDKAVAEAELMGQLKQEIGKVVVGQSRVLDRVLIALLTGGHILLEGVPGLAKTLTFQTLADTLSAKFQRIQFTPDLLPADILGTSIYNPRSGEFTTKKGPLFANLVLADEINRAPAKVQSALLEAMQERQITIGDSTFKLPELFLVLATQNPIEQEGTYPLPEAQMDRFMLKVRVEYPSFEEESVIVDRMIGREQPSVKPVLQTEKVLALRERLPDIYLDPRIKDYILKLVFTTRDKEHPELKNLITCGASPRASIALAKAARAQALLSGKSFVSPEDVKEIAFDVLRHRVIPSYEAEARGLDSDDLISLVFDSVEMP